MTVYNRRMAFAVEYVDEVGVHMLRFSRARIDHTEEFLDDQGYLVALVDVASDGGVVVVEILSLEHFDLDACAARYGFADRAGAIGLALAAA